MSEVKTAEQILYELTKDIYIYHKDTPMSEIDFFRGKQLEAMEEYASQFKGKEVTEEDIRCQEKWLKLLKEYDDLQAEVIHAYIQRNEFEALMKLYSLDVRALLSDLEMLNPKQEYIRKDMKEASEHRLKKWVEENLVYDSKPPAEFFKATRNQSSLSSQFKPKEGDGIEFAESMAYNYDYKLEGKWTKKEWDDDSVVDVREYTTPELYELFKKSKNK